MNYFFRLCLLSLHIYEYKLKAFVMRFSVVFSFPEDVVCGKQRALLKKYI